MPQTKAMTKIMHLMWTCNLVAFVFVFVSKRSSRSLGVPVNNLQFKRVTTSASVTHLMHQQCTLL